MRLLDRSSGPSAATAVSAVGGAVPSLPEAASGVLAGAFGTLAMDRLWCRRSDASDDGTPFTDWELSAGVDSFEEAGAPAQLGRMVAGAVGVELPERHAGLTADLVHWATGAGWGVGAAALRSLGVPPLAAGAAAGVAAVGTAYTVLGALGIYKPVWEYDARRDGPHRCARLRGDRAHPPVVR